MTPRLEQIIARFDGFRINGHQCTVPRTQKTYFSTALSARVGNTLLRRRYPRLILARLRRPALLAAAIRAIGAFFAGFVVAVAAIRTGR